MKAFFRTLVGGFRPIKFWKTLQPQQPSSPGRLIVYWLACVMLGALLPLMTIGEAVREKVESDAISRSQMNRFFRTSVPPARLQMELGGYPTIEAWLDEHYPTPLQAAFYHDLSELSRFTVPLARMSVFLAAWLLWPWVSFVCFIGLLRATLRDARVRQVHVLRVMLYSFDAIAWPGIVCAVLYPLVALAAAMKSRGFDFTSDLRLVDFTCQLMIVFAFVRLLFSCRHYLRLPHAVGVVMATQFITAAILFIVALQSRFALVTLFEYAREVIHRFAPP